MKKTIILATFFIFLMAVQVCSSTLSAFQPTTASTLLVTSDQLNVRTGPGKNFPAFHMLKKGDTVSALGALGDWYVIHLPDDSIGVVAKEYVKVTAESSADGDTAEVFNQKATPLPAPLEKDTEALLRLINDERTTNHLPVYYLDKGLCEIADMKADDMITNHYFSHQSKAYGSPFDMLKTFGILYKSAGENIAGNKTVQGANEQLMNSPYHRCNILNTGFNRIGISVKTHPQYGKIIVQIFTEQ